MDKDERLKWLKQIEKDIYVCSLESTFSDDAKSCAIHSAIEELENQKTGHWIISERDYTPKEYFNWNKTYLYKCSNCGREYEAEKGMGENYCANCGAKMEGEKE